MCSPVPVQRPSRIAGALALLMTLTGCTTVGDLFAGGPWCDERTHDVAVGESAARSEPCWREGVMCTLRNAIHSANLCTVSQILELQDGAEYVFDKADSTWAAGPAAYRRIVDPIERRLTIEGNRSTLRIAPGVMDLWYFEVEPDANLEIRNLTIVGGRRASCIRAGGASGVFNQGTLSLRRVTLLNHDTCAGAGAVYSDGRTFIEFSTFEGNSSEGAAALAVKARATADPPGRLEMSNSLFTNNRNRGDRGSNAIFVCGGVPCTITATSFVDNASGGSTIFMGPTNEFITELTINRSTISDNVGAVSGGISQFDGRLEVRDSTIAGNRGSEGSAYANDCCGSIKIVNSALSSPDATPVCAINPAGVLVTPDSHGVSTDASCAGLRQVTSLDVGPIDDNGGQTPTRLPAAMSPLVDTGRDCERVDQRGRPRPRGAACDVGAVEVQ